MLTDYGISQKEYQEAKNDKEIAIRLSDALDEIANGKIAVFGKMAESDLCSGFECEFAVVSLACDSILIQAYQTLPSH